MRVPGAKIPLPLGFSLPSPSQKPPSGSAWVHEIKHDGYRLIARRDGKRVRLYTRRGYDWRVYIGLSERACLPLSTGSASQGKARGKWGVAAGTLARQHNGVVRVFGRARSCNLASRQCRGSTGISQNGVSGVPLWDPVFAPLLVLPFNHSSCIYVSQDSGW
jgi:hypothetical protein